MFSVATSLRCTLTDVQQPGGAIYHCLLTAGHIQCGIWVIHVYGRARGGGEGMRHTNIPLDFISSSIPFIQIVNV